MITAFFMTIWMVWLLLMIWWVVEPRYFPFFPSQSFGRFGIFWFSLIIALMIPALAELLAMLTSIVSPDEPKGLMVTLGLFAGFGCAVWIIKLSLKSGKLNLLQERQVQDIHSVSTAAVVQFKSNKGKHKKRKTTKPNNKPKPALKEDFELGDDNLCEIQYKNTKGEISTRTILIRTLKANDNGDWYVSTVDIEIKEMKSFRIDRIISLSHNHQTWTEYDDILGIVRTFETLI